ncbi:hypothetical protein CY34DRAFT_810723 [Suillus luteus UH-Slu-Lm8-n1]|uniref:Uncharacterized protein n=1 Tax=Suillus luteus UH-Slu-Lm8-n1 TaxID=930992 RepID=A0A0D0A665_9AGAM|nr:hypothetical protein CY34DRAFT_810723 [Suillus luteus UH-Slu-Lm8-n1]
MHHRGGTCAHTQDAPNRLIRIKSLGPWRDSRQLVYLHVRVHDDLSQTPNAQRPVDKQDILYCTSCHRERDTQWQGDSWRTGLGKEFIKPYFQRRVLAPSL